MRISDWSSDVCSSDLAGRCRTSHRACFQYAGVGGIAPTYGISFSRLFARQRMRRSDPPPRFARIVGTGDNGGPGSRASAPTFRGSDAPASPPAPRSEEHTSELQSLMRISYAVFCLKQKKQRNK